MKGFVDSTGNEVATGAADAEGTAAAVSTPNTAIAAKAGKHKNRIIKSPSVKGCVTETLACHVYHMAPTTAAQ
jgi:hypothetical protein